MSPEIPEAPHSFRDSRAAFAAGVLLILLISAAVVSIGWPTLLAWVSTAFAALKQTPPALYFGTMALVCLFPIPISAFYIASGPLYGTLTALAWIAVALAFNILISHAIASSWLRPLMARLLEARGFRVPEPREGSEELMLIVLVRITPGLPFFAQNLLLGLANVDRLRSLLISLPIQMVFAAGFVLLGRSAFDGSAGLAVTAIGLIGSASIAARFVHQRLRKGRAEAIDS